MTPKPVPPISEERLRKAVERRKESVSGDVGWHINSEKDSHDFALWALKAKKVLKKNQGMRTIHGINGYCIECGGAIWAKAIAAERGCKDPRVGCAPDCAIAELLGEKSTNA